MARMFGFFGMTGGFLLISPNLRGQVGMAVATSAKFLNDYSPFSYIAVAIGIFVMLTISLYRTAR